MSYNDIILLNVRDGIYSFPLKNKANKDLKIIY